MGAVSSCTSQYVGGCRRRDSGRESRFNGNRARHPQRVYFTTRKSLVTLNTSGTPLAAKVAKFLSPSLLT
jgi:hypothetical protein